MSTKAVRTIWISVASVVGLGVLASGAMVVAKVYRSLQRFADMPASQIFSHPSAYSFAMQDGRILLVGARQGIGEPMAEFLDPATGAFSPALAPRHDHAFAPVGTLMADGRPLLTGGPVDSPGSQVLERFDADGVWREVGRLPHDVRPQDACTLQDGRILFTTGEGGAQGVLIWNPKNSEIQAIGHSAMVVNGSPLATLLQDGKVLITHLEYGQPRADSSNAFLFSPKTNRVTLAPRMARGRSSHQATALLDGRVLVTGEPEPSAECFDPVALRFNAMKPMIAPRALHRSVALKDGRVLLIGGVSPTRESDMPFLKGDLESMSADEIVKKAREHYEKHPPKLTPLASELEVFDPRDGSFRAVPPPPSHLQAGDGPRGGLHHVLPSGEVLFLSFNGPLKLDPGTMTWHWLGERDPAASRSGRRKG